MQNLNHDESHTFKLNDRVRIARKIGKCDGFEGITTNEKQFGWHCYWSTAMNDWVGRTGYVEDKGYQGIFVSAIINGGYRRAWFPSSALEKV